MDDAQSLQIYSLNQIPEKFYIFFGHLVKGKALFMRGGGINRRILPWSRWNPRFTTGLILHEQIQNSDAPTGVSNELAKLLQMSDDPMCWGYAMRMYCEKSLQDCEMHFDESVLNAYLLQKNFFYRN